MLSNSLIPWIYCLSVASTAKSQVTNSTSNSTSSSVRPRPYTINVNPALVSQTLAKVQSYRPSINIDEPAWADGAPATNISQVQNHWLHGYNWTSVQNDMNSRHPHFITTVSNTGSYGKPIDVHFIHERSNHTNATALLMLHGWPSSSNDWINIITPLASPPKASDPAFHVVTPDLPGFGFSSAPTGPGLGSPQIASAYVELMGQLGYQNFSVYSTDLGFYIGMHLVRDFPKQVSMHMTDFFLAQPNSTDLERYARNETTSEESRFISSIQDWYVHDYGYSLVHTTRPLSLSLAMADSPVGFLGWVWQITYAVSDGFHWSAESLITRTLLLFFPGPYGNIRLYKETFTPQYSVPPVTTVPTAIFQFGVTEAPYKGYKYVNFVPRSFIERYANIQFFFRTANGGHFPYETMPQLWLQQVRKAARKIL